MTGFAFASDLTPSSRLEDAVAIVAGAVVADEVAEGHRRHLLEFAARHADALERSCAEGHLTGSAAVIEQGSGRLAVLLHAKVGRWLQPGGHADGDANLAAVSLREAEEETGLDGLRLVVPAIDVDVHVFEAPAEPTHLHFDVRHLVVAPAGAQLVANHESHDLRWVVFGELAELGVDAGLLRMARQALDVYGSLGRR